MLEIRRATLKDSKSVREIYASVAGKGSTFEEARLDRLIREGGVLVAEGAAGVIGFGSIEVGAPEHIKWLYVLTGHQGGGVGSEMLRQLEGMGWEAGLNSIRLHASPGAVGFYRRSGYREVAPGEEVGQNHDGVEMVKERGHDGGPG
jgi:GNAT superfamily N-acetyltransferase